MSPKRRVTVNEFDKYTAAAQSAEPRSARDAEENGNAFPFDKEFEPGPGDAFDPLPVVDTVKASLIYPDALQPRPSPLPDPIRAKFRRGEIDAFQAGREWLKLAEKDALLSYDIQRYLSMGENIAANGQINPITGRWEQAVLRGKEKRIFRIETGEQRFWSSVLHHIHEKQEPDALTLKVSVVPLSAAPDELATVRRQISENRKNMQLTEVLQAREIARLLLVTITAKTGQAFAVDPNDEYEYFRGVLRLGRVPHGVWDTVQAEFNLGQHRMRQSLEILRLPSPLLDLAHKAKLSYRSLSQILKQDPTAWTALVQSAAAQALADEELENDETTAAVAQEGEESAGGAEGSDSRPSLKARKLVDPAELAYRGVRRFYRSAIKGVHSNPLLIQAVADNVIMDGYAEEVIDFMEDLVRAIRTRLNEEDLES
jgi:hypothetical protein